MKVKRSDRERAKYAFECVEKLIKDNSSYGSDYKSYVKSFPMMILQNGLGNAIAFAYSKSKDKNGNLKAWAYVLWHIRCWLTGETNKCNNLSDFDSKIKEFIKKEIVDSPTSSYRKNEKEAIALLNWLRRFAEGMIEDSGGGNVKE